MGGLIRTTVSAGRKRLPAADLRGVPGCRRIVKPAPGSSNYSIPASAAALRRLASHGWRRARGRLDGNRSGQVKVADATVKKQSILIGTSQPISPELLETWRLRAVAQRLSNE